jgi:hypothetical protein
VQIGFRGIDPTEPLALARLACRTSRNGDATEVLAVVDRVLGMAIDVVARSPETPLAFLPAAMAALTLAGTTHAGVPVATA